MRPLPSWNLCTKSFLKYFFLANFVIKSLLYLCLIIILFGYLVCLPKTNFRKVEFSCKVQLSRWPLLWCAIRTTCPYVWDEDSFDMLYKNDCWAVIPDPRWTTNVPYERKINMLSSTDKNLWFVFLILRDLVWNLGFLFFYYSHCGLNSMWPSEIICISQFNNNENVAHWNVENHTYIVFYTKMFEHWSLY